MTLSCWQEDPSHRPTVAVVVRFLREWPVVPFSIEPTSLHDSFSYTLRAANLSSPTLAPWRQEGSVNGATNYTPIYPTLLNGKPTSPQPSGISRQSGRLKFQTNGNSTEPSSTHAHSYSGNFNSGCLLSIVYHMHLVHADNHSTVPTPYVRLEDSSSEAAKRRTNEIAKVTQLVISPSSSDHTPVLGAHASEFMARAGGRHQIFVAHSPQYSRNPTI